MPASTEPCFTKKYHCKKHILNNLEMYTSIQWDYKLFVIDFRSIWKQQIMSWPMSFISKKKYNVKWNIVRWTNNSMSMSHTTHALYLWKCKDFCKLLWPKKGLLLSRQKHTNPFVMLTFISKGRFLCLFKTYPVNLLKE